MQMKINLKNIKKDQVLMILLAGILLVVIAMPVSKGGGKDETSGTQKASTKEEFSSYEDTVEARLEKALKKVEGVGDVKVMVTLKASAEKVIEKDTEQNNQTTEDGDKEGGKKTTKDSSAKQTTVYDSGDAGTQTPYVSKEISPQIAGVLVIAKGGGNAVVIENITEAVQALFEVDTHKIKIMKMN